jgi:hypothetical protein
MKDLLIKLDACHEAKDWANDKSWKEIYDTCHRGDWLLWLFKKTNPNDLQPLTLAKAHCANTVRHLLKDERSIKAIDVAIAFGEGKASREELDAAASAASAAAADAYAAYAAAYAASYASADAYASAAYAAYAAYASAAAPYAASSSYAAADAASYAAADAAYYAADICRKYLPIEIWNI